MGFKKPKYTPPPPDAAGKHSGERNEAAEEERLHGRPHLCVIAVDVVEDPDEDVFRDVVESHHRDAGLRLQLLALTEMVFKKGFEIITATTEKCLGREERPTHFSLHQAKQHYQPAVREAQRYFRSSDFVTLILPVF